VGRTAQTIDARGTITAFAYDAAGQRLAVTNAFGITGVQNVSSYAPVGASLDVDDVAGEIDQDWREGRAPFREDRLPDGGSGGPARVVPIHSGRDWTAEITGSNIWMKEPKMTGH
jgi:YD repeat-containing protein